MPWDLYFRYNLRYGHTFKPFRPRISDLFKIPKWRFVNFPITACMHLTLCVGVFEKQRASEQYVFLVVVREAISLNAVRAFFLNFLEKWSLGKRMGKQICPRNTNYKCVVSTQRNVLPPLLGVPRDGPKCRPKNKHQNYNASLRKCQ